MSQMLSWFSNLEPVEKSSAMAIIDDPNFLHFYIDLMRNEHQQQQSSDGSSHALFMKDYLLSLFLKAKTDRKVSREYGLMLGIQKSSDIDAADIIIPAADTILLSFLNTGQTIGLDTSDFSDPFLFPSYSSSTGSSSRSKCLNNSFCPKGSSSPSASFVSKSNAKQEIDPTFSASGEISALDMEVGYQSAVNSFFKTAVLNVANELGNHNPDHDQDSCIKIPFRTTTATDSPENHRRVQLDQQGRKDSGRDHFEIASELNESVAVSFATSGTRTFDCLFLMRPITEDFSKLSEIFEILSNGLMFSEAPSYVEVKAATSGKSLPLIGWLSNLLTAGSEVGVRSVPVPYYLLLLSRIELSMWSAYFSCVHSAKTGSELPCDGDDSSDVSQGNYHSILLLPRSNNHFKGKASNQVQIPLRNSLRVLERSSLYSLASTSVMLTLGCIIEEHKLLWRVLPKGENLKVLNLFPSAKSFYSDPTNSRGRPESIVDRLVLCPLGWIVETEESESDVKRAYEYLEKIAHAAAFLDMRKDDGTSTEQLLNQPIVSGLSISTSGSSRPGFIKFDENVKRTGAIKSSVMDSVDVGCIIEDVAMKVATIKNIGHSSGLTKRKVLHPATEQVSPKPLSLPLSLSDELKLTSLKPSVSFEIVSEVERNDEELKEKHRLKKIMANKEVELDKKVKELNIVPFANISLSSLTNATSSVEIIDSSSANDVPIKNKKNKKKNKSTASTAEKESKSLEICMTSEEVEVGFDSMTKNENTNFEGDHVPERRIIKNLSDECEEVRDEGTLISADTANAAMGLSPCTSVLAADSPSLLSPLLSQEHRSLTARLESELDSHLMKEVTEVLAAHPNTYNPSEIERRRSESDDSFQLVLPKSKKNLSKQLKHFASLNEASNSDTSQPLSRSTVVSLRGDKILSPVPKEIKCTNSVMNHPESTASTDESSPPDFTFKSLVTKSHTEAFVANKKGDDQRVESESSIMRCCSPIESSSEAVIPVMTLPMISTSITTASASSTYAGQSDGDSLQGSQFSSRRTNSLDEDLIHSTSNTLHTGEDTVSAEKIKLSSSLDEVNDASCYPITDPNLSQLSDHRSSNSRHAVSMRRSAPYRETGSYGSSGRGARESSDWKAKNTSLKIQKTLTKNIRSFNNIMNGRMEVHKLVRIALYLEIRSMVISLWPSAAVRIFGSCITGLALPSSDIDLVIQLSRQQQPYPQHESQISCQPTSLTHPCYSEPRSPSNGPIQDQGQIHGQGQGPGQGHGQGQGYYQHEQYSPSRVPQMPWLTYSENVSRMEMEMEMEMALDDNRGRRRGTSFSHSSSPSSEVYPGTSSVFYSEAGERRGSRGGLRSGSIDSTSLLSNPFPAHFYGPPHLRNQLNANSSGPLGMSPHQYPDSGMSVPPPPFRSLPPSSEDFNSLFFALTSQLYMQIWASQVNPIPSAAVPVIKLRVAADSLLANPAMQQAVCAVHQQQLLSPILEPTTFPTQFTPVLNSPSRNELYPCPLNSHFPPSFPSTSSSFNYKQDQTIGINRDREPIRGEEGLVDRPTRSHQNSLGSDGGNERPAAFVSSVHRYDGSFVESPYQHTQRQQQMGTPKSQLQHYQHQQQYQQQQQQQQQSQQQQQQQHFPYQLPFIGSPGRRSDQVPYNPALIHGQQSAYPPLIPFAFLPFHMAAGVVIAVDITLEAGQHKGLSSCDFVQGCLSSRSAVLPAVVKVVKALLVQSKLNAPFSGGLSSYSAFLLVLAAYDRCQYSEDRQPLFTRRRGTSCSNNVFEPSTGGHSDIEDSSSSDRIDNTAPGSVPTLPVTEGEVFLHFLTLYALSSSTFNPLTQGIDVRCGDHTMLSYLTPDQQATVAGGGLWIVDPLDSTKNVARPSFAFRQAQMYFKQCLDKIEGAAQMMTVGTDGTSLDFLKLLMRYS